MAVDSKTNMFNVFEKCKILQLMNRSQAQEFTGAKLEFMTPLINNTDIQKLQHYKEH